MAELTNEQKLALIREMIRTPEGRQRLVAAVPPEQYEEFVKAVGKSMVALARGTLDRPRAWAPEGDGLPRGYTHHPGVSTGPYWQAGHVVCRVVDGVEPHSVRVVWQAVGRDSQHALELGWQHREGEPLDDPVAVWDADDHPDFVNTGLNRDYPYPIAPQW